MIALTSARPMAQSQEYARNQLFALKSWTPDIFSNVYYFGHYEEGLDGEHIMFARTDEGEWPRIKHMADFASRMTSEYVAIVNADIVVTAGLAAVERKMREMALPAATSYRQEFDPENPNLETATRHKEDRGMDIFIANPKIWGMVAKAIPDYLRIGAATWDTWVCGFFCDTLGYGFRHFTDERCIFHPRHGGRLTPYNDEIRNDSKYFTLAKRPSPL